MLSLFLMTGSVVMGAKILLLNALTLGAVYGVLVLTFQDGRLEGPLGFTSLGALDTSAPIVLFAAVFALATDYGIFLLVRVKESVDAGVDNDDAVAVGQERTGRAITSAAACSASRSVRWRRRGSWPCSRPGSGSRRRSRSTRRSSGPC
jgi:uncharacterized membrane protein YdfJ with MMPL/SSD domain